MKNLHFHQICFFVMWIKGVATEYNGRFNLDYVIWQIVVQRMMVVLLLMMMAVIVIMVAALSGFSFTEL